MNYPENMPSSENTQKPISEAEIVKQHHELESEDARAQQLLAHQALIADTESIDALGTLLTGSSTSDSETIYK